MKDGLRPAAAESSGPGSPAAVLEITDSFAADHDPFGLQQPALQRRRASIPPEPAGRRDDAVAGYILGPAVPHDVADRSRRTWPARELRYVTVGRHVADRDAADSGEDAGGEVG